MDKTWWEIGICNLFHPSFRDQQQVDLFLATDAGKDFTFVKDEKILAHTSGYDGFYMALLERKNS